MKHDLIARNVIKSVHWVLKYLTETVLEVVNALDVSNALIHQVALIKHLH